MNSVTKLFLDKVKNLGFTVSEEYYFLFQFGLDRQNLTFVYCQDTLMIIILLDGCLNIRFKDWGDAEQFIAKDCLYGIWQRFYE